jgi:hypothetical protein
MRTLNQREFSAIVVQAGLTLDRNTLAEYYDIYVRHIVPILNRLRWHHSLESNFEAPPHSER